MSELTMVLSGPAPQAPPLRERLGHAGCTVEPTTHDHGLPAVGATEEFPDGQDDPTVAFVTVHGSDLHDVIDIAAIFGWTLRAHWDKPEDQPPNALGQWLEAVGEKLGLPIPAGLALG
jgi:hypothetical protein